MGKDDWQLMKSGSKRLIIITILVIAFTVIAITGGIMVGKYKAVDLLCNEIKEGKEISTDIGNGLTAPGCFEPIARIMQIEGPQTPLKVACYYRNVQAVETLLKNGADPNFHFKDSYTPLEASIVNGPIDQNSVEIVKLLIKYGADIDEYGSSEPILITVSGSIGSDNPYSYELFNLLLDSGASCVFNGNNRVMFNVARFASYERAAEFFKSRQYDINEVDAQGRSVLINAVQRSDTTGLADLVQLLLRCGVDKSIADQTGHTAYDYALQSGREDIISLLES